MRKTVSIMTEHTHTAEKLFAELGWHIISKAHVPPDSFHTSYVISDIANEYDPNFGDDKECVCGHAYYRHFDTYEDMYPVGCKYRGQCHCKGFSLKKEE